ncbi:MAG: hypothetical protein GY774_36180 [Planctomycetes bacterium]|nr:hypothetical protein [Planctomycetota bacterium]
MAEINQLTALDSVVASDLLAVYSSANGDARKASMTVLLDYMQRKLDFSPSDLFTTQYSAPSATGFSIQITDGDDSIHLILTPGATYATGTIVLPTSTNSVDKQEVLINCTQIVTTLTVDGNGATVTGEPSAFAANGYFKLKFDSLTTTWYRVG